MKVKNVEKGKAQPLSNGCRPFQAKVGRTPSVNAAVSYDLLGQLSTMIC